MKKPYLSQTERELIRSKTAVGDLIMSRFRNVQLTTLIANKGINLFRKLKTYSSPL